MTQVGRGAKLGVVLIVVGVAFGAGEIHKEYRFSVGRKASVSIINEYGPISVRPTGGNEVIVTTITNSDSVQVDPSHSSNRVDLQSHLLPGADSQTGRVEYEVQVPADASVMLHSSDGALHAEKLSGDLTMEGASGAVDVRDIDNAHVHIKTLSGPVTLSNVQEGHVEVTSLSGNVTMNNVNAPIVEVNSNSGKINYAGNFGDGGNYSFTSHTGDIEAIAPATASIDVKARSIKGQVESDFQLDSKQHSSFVSQMGSAFVGTIGKGASSVKLHSISGRIHLKKRISN
jgi:DUF4097 and DUF4098 domain-containing protein YvlB